MTDQQIVTKAADAIQAYHAWEERTKPKLAHFLRRAKRYGSKEIRAERRAYMKANPQPQTADEILSKYARGDMRLWTHLCGLVTAEVKRRGLIAETRGPRSHGMVGV